jgi:F-type H+-transporting ATPase subunit epsilon
MLVLLGKGPLRIRTKGGEQRFDVEGGFLQVVDDIVTVLSERADAT